MEGQLLKKEPKLSGLENSQSIHITTDTKACSGETPRIASENILLKILIISY